MINYNCGLIILIIRAERKALSFELTYYYIPMYYTLNTSYLCVYIVLLCWLCCYHAFEAVRAMKENNWGFSIYWKDKNSNSSSSRQICFTFWPLSLEKDGSVITGLDEYQKDIVNQCVCMRRMSCSCDYSLFIFYRHNNYELDHSNSIDEISWLKIIIESLHITRTFF